MGGRREREQNSTGSLDGFLARHHNVRSWYVRPLFVLPLAYLSYRRSLTGIALVALSTSMFCDAAVLYAIDRLRTGNRAKRPVGEPSPRSGLSAGPGPIRSARAPA